MSEPQDVPESKWPIPARYPSAEKSPEELVSEAEELDSEAESEPEPEPDPLERDKILRALSRLSLEDQDLVRECVLGEMTQVQYALITGLTQPGVSYRIGRVFERLRWFCGTGGAFTSLELKAACEPYLKPKTVAWLCVYWTTGNVFATNKLLRLASGSDRAWYLRSMRELAAVPELTAYYDALSELKLRGPKLMYFVNTERNTHKGEKRGPISPEALAKLRSARLGVRHARYRVR